MHQLSDLPDFDASRHPELASIFRSIDAGVAAIVAADPAFRPRSVRRRRQSSDKMAGLSNRRGRGTRRDAA